VENHTSFDRKQEKRQPEGVSGLKEILTIAVTGLKQTGNGQYRK
jgi:hypothetical protein